MAAPKPPKSLSISALFIRNTAARSVLLIFLWYISHQLHEVGGLMASLLILVFSLLLFPSISLKLAERHSKSLTVFKNDGLLKKLLSGLFLRIVISISVAVSATLALIIFLAETDFSFWVLAIFSSTISLSVQQKLNSATDKEFRFPFGILRENALSKGIASILGATGYLLYLVFWSGEAEASPIYESHFIQEMISLSKIFGIFNDQIIESIFISDSFMVWLVGAIFLIIKSFTGFYLSLSLSDLFVLPANISTKSIAPIKYFEDQDLSGKNFFLWAVCITIFTTIVFWLPTTARIEFALSQRHITKNAVPLVENVATPLRESIIEIAEIIEVAVEIINGETYRPGTLTKVAELEQALAQTYDDKEFKARARAEINKAFQTFENNIDIFLNHYYSLESEYVRIAKMFTGELDQYLKDELTKSLRTGDPLKSMNSVINAENKKRAEFNSKQDKLLKELKLILDQRRVEIGANERAVILDEGYTKYENITLSDIIGDRESRTPIRWGASASTGLIVGLVVKQVVAKGTIKTLASAAMKVAVKKAGGAAAGGLIGGVLGSVVPGVGTVTIGAIGTLIGTVTVDWTALKLDEIISREAFKEDIAREIRSQRDSLLGRF